MTVYIRTEANRTTATGHMTRCIAIAREIRAMGGEVIFIVAEMVSTKLIIEAGFEYICLDRVWDDFDGEIPVITRLIEDNDIKIMLIDSYYVSSNYMAAVSSKTRTAYIDDLHDRVWQVGAIINYAVYSDLFDYESEYPHSDLLLGTEYMPLRPEYTDIEVREKTDCKNVLVVTGGGDEYHFIKRLAGIVSGDEEMKESKASAEVIKNMCFTFICGAFNVDYDELAERYGDGRYENIKILKSVPSLKDYLLEADMIVTAGGTTLYEAAMCQVPCIAFRIADNQDYNVTAFGKKGLAIDAGDVRYDFSYEELMLNICEISENKEFRDEMRRKQSNAVDGRGAGRIASYLMSKCN